MQKWLALLCALLLGCTPLLRAADAQPVGYLIQTQDEIETDEDEAEADTAVAPDAPQGAVVKKAATSQTICIRDGKRLLASAGMEVFASDVITTDDNSSIGIAFLDSNAITLRPASRIKIDDYAYPAQHAATHVSLEAGKAFFSINPRPDDANFFVKMQHSAVQANNTKFELIQTLENGIYSTHIAVLKGTVSFVPDGAKALDIMAGMLMVMKLNSTTAPTVDTVPIDKNQLALLKQGAITDINVSINSKNVVNIKSVHTNPDGSKMVISLTEINGKTTKVTTKVTDAYKNVLSSSNINNTTDKKTEFLAYSGLVIKETMKSGSGAATIKDGRQVYKGTVKTLPDGTEVTDCTNKFGGRIVITRQELADGTVIMTKTVFAAGKIVDSGTRLTETIFRDGSKTSFTEIVDLNLKPLVPNSGKTPGPSSPASPPGAPGITTAGSIIIVPDTTPVSP